MDRDSKNLLSRLSRRRRLAGGRRLPLAGSGAPAASRRAVGLLRRRFHPRRRRLGGLGPLRRRRFPGFAMLRALGQEVALEGRELLRHLDGRRRLLPSRRRPGRRLGPLAARARHPHRAVGPRRGRRGPPSATPHGPPRRRRQRRRRVERVEVAAAVVAPRAAAQGDRLPRRRGRRLPQRGRGHRAHHRPALFVFSFWGFGSWLPCVNREGASRRLTFPSTFH